MESLSPSWLGFKTTKNISVEPIEGFGSVKLPEEVSSDRAEMSPGMYVLVYFPWELGFMQPVNLEMFC